MRKLSDVFKPGSGYRMFFVSMITFGLGYGLYKGIIDNYYTVDNLQAEGTFVYRVKALYNDGSESEWSNRQEVTLFQNSHGFEPGDVDHNGRVAIADVTALLDLILGIQSGYCTKCADVDLDGIVDIGDVTALVDAILLSDD